MVGILLFSLLGLIVILYVRTEIKEYLETKKLLDKQLGPEKKE